MPSAMHASDDAVAHDADDEWASLSAVVFDRAASGLQAPYRLVAILPMHF